MANPNGSRDIYSPNVDSEIEEHTTTLCTLPVEILLQIFGYTSILDIDTLKGVCKRVNHIISKNSGYVEQVSLLEQYGLDFKTVQVAVANPSIVSPALFHRDHQFLKGSTQEVHEGHWALFRDYLTALIRMPAKRKEYWTSHPATATDTVCLSIASDICKLDQALTCPAALARFIDRRFKDIARFVCADVTKCVSDMPLIRRDLHELNYVLCMQRLDKSDPSNMERDLRELRPS